MSDTNVPITTGAPKPRDPRALNAMRHSLTGQIHLFTPADQAAYDKHCRGYHQSLAPEGNLETDIVQSIADDRWRLKRAASLESAIFAAGITLPDRVVSSHPEVDTALAQGRVWLEKGGNLQLLGLYENRIQRRFEKNMAELRILQAQRKAALDQAVEIAGLLKHLTESRGGTFSVEHDFPCLVIPKNFDFSLSDIAALVAHRRCLADAQKVVKFPQRTPKMVA